MGVGTSGLRRKFSWGGFHSVAYGGHFHLVCGLCDVTILRHLHVSRPTFWRSVLTYESYLSKRTPLILCVIALNTNLSALQVGISEENKLNSTTQQFITAKISGSMIKQGGKTHSSLRQRNLQRQNKAALMFFQIRAVEHRKCASGLDDAHRGLQDRTC